MEMNIDIPQELKSRTIIYVLYTSGHIPVNGNLHTKEMLIPAHLFFITELVTIAKFRGQIPRW
jgi:hypothetical protein